MKKNIYIPYVIALIIGVAYSIVCVILPTISGAMINHVIEMPQQSGKFIFIFAFVGFVKFILAVSDRVTYDFYITKQKKHMRNVAFQAITMKNSIDQGKRAEITSFINNDIPSIVEQYYAGNIDIIKCVCIVVFGVLSLIKIHWSMAIVIISACLIIVFIPGILKKAGGETRANYSVALKEYNAKLISFLDGLAVMKTYLYRNRSIRLLEKKNTDVYTYELKTKKYRWIISQIATLAQIGREVLILIIGAELILRGVIQVGDLVSIISLASVVAAPIEVLSYLIHARNEVKPLQKKYTEMVKSVSNNEESESGIGKIETIDIENLSYSIGDNIITKSVNMHFKKGKKYIVTGKSGCGKSTLFKLLMGVSDVNYHGSIQINGQELNSIERKCISSHIAYCQQEPYIFYENLKENICLGRKISDEKYKETISKLNLEYLLDRYENKEITPEITEKLSGGEKQRVSIARAMVAEPEVYFLDEVTSALDYQNANEIEQLLLSENAMIIHVCHKQNESLKQQYDLIYEM